MARRTKWLGKGEREIVVGSGEDAVCVVVRDLTERDVRELRAEVRDLTQTHGQTRATLAWVARVAGCATVRVSGYERGDGEPIATGADLEEHGEVDVLEAVFAAVWPSGDATGNG